MGSRIDEIRGLSRQSGLSEGQGKYVENPSSSDPEAPIADRINCPMCDEEISARAKKCRHCGETLDVSLRIAEEARRASERQGNVYMNSAAAMAPQSYSRTKSRIAAFILAWLFGGIGVHKFYLGQAGLGILYLLFCWTFIPMIIAFIEGIIYLAMSDESFWQKYG